MTDGLANAVEQARAAAGDKDVAVAGGGTLLRETIEAGLLDQPELHVVPVVLGDGMRLFEPADLALPGGEGIERTPTRIVDTPDVTHIRYRVDGRSPLVDDERASQPIG